ncbi:MAG: antibiotic biosynthesis monooxygenase [Parasphingorhabdus sp.]|nr:antibiotic biosynthesis monooxygenase [Parasphingorhabdus sp.]
MSGVKITFALKLIPEAVDAFCSALPETVKDTAKRPGFRDLCVVRHATDPSRLMFIETWDSEQSYHDYIAWRTERGEMDGMSAILAEPPQLDVWPILVAAA